MGLWPRGTGPRFGYDHCPLLRHSDYYLKGDTSHGTQVHHLARARNVKSMDGAWWHVHFRIICDVSPLRPLIASVMQSIGQIVFSQENFQILKLRSCSCSDSKSGKNLG